MYRVFDRTFQIAFDPKFCRGEFTKIPLEKLRYLSTRPYQIWQVKNRKLGGGGFRKLLVLGNYCW